MAMGLSRRLAIFAACMAAALVLVVTEAFVRLTERSRLEDLRLEAQAVASTLADYLNRAAPTANPTALHAALATWAGLHLRETSAAVYARGSGGDFALAGSTDSASVPELTAGERRAIGQELETIWQDEGTQPAWRVAEPLGNGRRVTGLLSLRLSTAGLQQSAHEERRRGYLLAAVSGLLLAGGNCWLTSRGVGAPLRALDDAMAGAYAGARTAPPALEFGPAEFRSLARRYNALRAALAERERESEARAALLALEERARGLERLALVDEASASFAHEIGTPLNTMNGHFQLLREDLLALGAPAAAHRVDLVLSQVQRVAGIVQAWLARGAWPQPAAGTLVLAEVAQRMREFLEPSLTAAGVSTVLENPAMPPVTARGDAELVEQILLNLLKNAMEALPRGGEIHLAMGGDGRTTWLTVSDNGPGISESVKRQLFHPFATTKGSLGTGLGLTVSRRLARGLGGDLIHEPTAIGTRWRLVLPAAP